MFDMNDDTTLKDIENYWMNSVKDYGPENIVLALVGNKNMKGMGSSQNSLPT